MGLTKLLTLSIVFSSFALATISTKRVTVVTGPDYAPLVDESEVGGGLATQIVRQALVSQGLQMQLDFLPWKRGAEIVSSGLADVTFPYVKNSEREKDFYFSDVIYTSRSRFFHLKNEIKSLADIRGRTLCRPVGYDVERIKPTLVKYELKLVQPSELTNCFGMLEKGRVDLVAVSEEVGWHIINKSFSKSQGFNTLDPVLEEVDYYLLVGKKNPRAKEILAAFNRGIAELRKKSSAP